MSLKRLSTDGVDDVPTCKKLCAPDSVEENGTTENGDNGNSSSSELLEPIVNSTYAALVYIRDLFPMRKFENRLPQIILRHQLYSIVRSHDIVDLQLEELLSSGEIKMFRNGPNGTVFVVFTNDYRSYVQQQVTAASDCTVKSAVVDRLLAVDIPNSMELALSRHQLVDVARLTDDDVKNLVSLQLLLQVDVDSWCLAIPTLNMFTKSFNLGRKAILTTVNKCKYHEILQEELMLRKLPRVARLGIVYHVHDIIGADLVECEKTAIGIVLRLRTPSSSSSLSSISSLSSWFGPPTADAATVTTLSHHSSPSSSPPEVNGSEEVVGS